MIWAEESEEERSNDQIPPSVRRQCFLHLSLSLPAFLPLYLMDSSWLLQFPFGHAFGFRSHQKRHNRKYPFRALIEWDFKLFIILPIHKPNTRLHIRSLQLPAIVSVYDPTIGLAIKLYSVCLLTWIIFNPLWDTWSVTFSGSCSRLRSIKRGIAGKRTRDPRRPLASWAPRNQT